MKTFHVLEEKRNNKKLRENTIKDGLTIPNGRQKMHAISNIHHPKPSSGD
jgi:hypothetical protein